ncbi:MAG: HEAT repeat domain-containing protein [Verrucomicrobiales bacterium]
MAGITLLLVCSCQEADEDVFERRFALTKIPGFGIEDHIALLDHQDPNIRYLAVANLLQLGALAQPGENDEDGAGGDEFEMLVAKLRALLADPAPKVRAIAAYAPINRVGDGAEERLVTTLDDAHSAVRVEAVVSLGTGEFGEGGELSLAATERVAGLLEDPNVLVRLHALEALGASGNSEGAGALVEKIGLNLAQGETPEILKALEALGHIDGGEAEKILLGRLDDEDELAVTVAVTGLVSREPQPQALEEWVLKSLADGRPSEDFLVKTLVSIATERSRGVAISMLDHADANTRCHCVAILERIGDQASFEALAAALQGMIPAVEERLALPGADPVSEEAEFLGVLGSVSGMGEKLGAYRFDREGIGTLLGSRGVADQLVAVFHLIDEEYFDAPVLGGGDGGANFGDRLRELATSQSPLMRAIAYDALGNSAGSEVGGILVGGLADPVYQVRFSALEALVHHSATTGSLSPLRSAYERRQEFEPTTYASDDPALLMRERLEHAIREFEPSWTSVSRAEAEIARGELDAGCLLAAEFLAPREEAIDVLLKALATGSDGVKDFASRTIEGHVGKQHLKRLRAILAAETNADRQASLAEIIAGASE